MRRTKDKIWDHFEKLKVDGNIRARWRKCSHELVNNAERMRGHWNFCSKRASTVVSDEATQPKQRCLTQTTLNIATTSAFKQKEIGILIAKFIIGTNSPLLHAENQICHRLVEGLRPGTKIPTRQLIAGPLLDKVFEEEKGKVEKLLKNQLGTLALDGRSTKVLQPVVGVAITGNGNTYLCDTLDTSGQPHTAEYLFDIFKSQVEKVEEDRGVSICCYWQCEYRGWYASSCKGSLGITSFVWLSGSSCQLACKSYQGQAKEPKDSPSAEASS